MSISDEIEKLKSLHDKGILTDEEFEKAKQRVLKDPDTGSDYSQNSWRSFRKSSKDKWIAGVCGGLGEITPIPSWIWRVVFCISVLFAGFGCVLYILLWIFAPPAVTFGQK